MDSRTAEAKQTEFRAVVHCGTCGRPARTLHEGIRHAEDDHGALSWSLIDGRILVPKKTVK